MIGWVMGILWLAGFFVASAFISLTWWRIKYGPG
jgi:hypothetical protein